MKKFLMIMAAAICLAGCSTSSQEVIYDITLTYTKSSVSLFNTPKAYTEISSKLSAFSKEYGDEWIATVHNGNFSKTDKSAQSRFNTAAEAFENVKSECKAILENSSSSDSFTIGVSLVLKRFSDGEDHLLDSRDAEFSK